MNRKTGQHDGEQELGVDPASAEGHDIAGSVRNYVVGMVLAAGLAVASFWIADGASLICRPGAPLGLAALAIAQMGVHLAFFLHIAKGPDNFNNVPALAFGVLIVGVVIAGSLWIMVNANMMVPGEIIFRSNSWAAFWPSERGCAWKRRPDRPDGGGLRSLSTRQPVAP